jgi:hypothetical protein
MNIKKSLIITITILTIILLTLIFILTQPFITGRAIQELHLNYYTYTKAICNETNFCQDNIITCQDQKLISTKPITGAIIQHPEDWQDPRTPTELCEE